MCSLEVRVQLHQNPLYLYVFLWMFCPLPWPFYEDTASPVTFSKTSCFFSHYSQTTGIKFGYMLSWFLVATSRQSSSFLSKIFRVIIWLLCHQIIIGSQDLLWVSSTDPWIIASYFSIFFPIFLSFLLGSLLLFFFFFLVYLFCYWLYLFIFNLNLFILIGG